MEMAARDLDSPGPAIKDDAPAAPAAGASSTPAAAPGAGGQPPPAADPPADGAPAAAAPPAAPGKPKEEERDETVIELTRRSREADGKAAEATKRAEAAERKVQALAPLAEIFRLAESDPLAFVTEIADVVGLTPERVLNLIQTKGAGGTATLTPEDKIAMLERQIAELRGDGEAGDDEDEDDEEPEPTGEGAQARAGFVKALDATIKAAPEKYPLAADEPAAPNAAFIVMVRHWEAHKDAPGYKPLAFDAAVAAVEQSLRKEAEAKARKAGLIGAASAPPPQHPGGPSNSMAGPVVPADQRPLSDREIAAAMRREFGE